MTEQSLPLRLLNSQCLQLDPNSPFISTSPLMGMAHGNYVFRDLNTKEEVFAHYGPCALYYLYGVWHAGAFFCRNTEDYYSAGTVMGHLKRELHGKVIMPIMPG